MAVTHRQLYSHRQKVGATITAKAGTSGGTANNHAIDPADLAAFLYSAASPAMTSPEMRWDFPLNSATTSPARFRTVAS